MRQLPLFTLLVPWIALAACRGKDVRETTVASTAGAATLSPGDSGPHDTALMRRADHARISGSSAAPVWMVEVSDFQCPFCRRWHDESYPDLKRDYVDAGKVRLAYINFPLSSHRNAWPAAEAAMCAAAQDKFWQMHDALFSTQDKWEDLPSPGVFLDSLALAAGVDTAAFKRCETLHLTRPLIEADVERASSAGVESTPSFLIGSVMIRGAQPTQAFRQALDAALARAASTSPKP